MCSRLPLNAKMLLPGTIANPMEAHVDCVRVFGLDGVLCETDSTFVVACEQSGRLRVAEIVQCVAERFGTFANCMERTVLSFCCG